MISLKNQIEKQDGTISFLKKQVEQSQELIVKLVEGKKEEQEKEHKVNNKKLKDQIQTLSNKI